MRTFFSFAQKAFSSGRNGSWCSANWVRMAITSQHCGPKLLFHFLSAYSYINIESRPLRESQSLTRRQFFFWACWKGQHVTFITLRSVTVTLHQPKRNMSEKIPVYALSKWAQNPAAHHFDFFWIFPSPKALSTFSIKLVNHKINKYI